RQNCCSEAKCSSSLGNPALRRPVFEAELLTVWARGRSDDGFSCSPGVHRRVPSLGLMNPTRIPALPLAASVLFAATPNKAKVHGYDLTGTIAGLDQSKKTLVVESSAGKQTKLSWTDATKIMGGPLAVGQSVTLRYLDK